MIEFDELVVLMDRLRGEGGCPWDRQQTPKDLKGYLIEEAHEVTDAIDSGAPDRLCEELGDLLFQILFLARIASERGEFTIREVVRGIHDKMTRRHPHVFGDAKADTPDEVLRQWERIKRSEKPATGPVSALDGIPRSLPALLKAERLGAKASRLGFDWSQPREVVEKIEEEVAELRAASENETPERVAEEMGDIIFALASLARHLGTSAEEALQGANARFTRRFQWMEADLRQRGREVSSEDASELDRLWREAKKA
jgi:MazG family protein